MISSVVETGVLFYTCIGQICFNSFDADCNMDLH